MATAVAPPPPGASPEQEPYARRWWGLLVLSLALVLIGLDNTILNVALPTLVREIDATNSQLQWIVDSYVLVFAGLLLTAGSLGDRFGRKGALNAGLLIFLGGALYASTTDDATHLIASRAVMGIGGAFIMPATLSILTNMFPPHERGRAIGIWAGVAGIGIPLGPLLGGWLLEHFAWGSIFLVNVPLVLIALAAGWVLLPDSRDPQAPKIDLPGAVLSMAGLSVFIYGLIEAPLHGWGSTSTLLALGGGVLLLAVFAWVESRTKEPMLDLRFFKNPRFSAANAAITLVFFALFGSMFSMTQYLQFVLGYSALESGIRMLPMAVGMMIGAPVSARLVERTGAKVVVAGGLSLVTLALVMLTQLEPHSSYMDFLLPLLVLSLGMGLTMAPATEAIMGAIPRAKAGVGSAMNDTTRQVGGALGVATIGSLMSSTYRANVESALTSLPADLVERAKDSVGAALAIAGQSGAQGEPIAEQAKQAFSDAMAAGFIAAALISALGVLLVILFLPAHGVDAGETFEDAEARGVIEDDDAPRDAVGGAAS
ncbi:MAG: MFS transporter [Dehalococcoidia bacterium]|nr:MFS transporter [Dehalococcoidia bacterium]